MKALVFFIALIFYMAITNVDIKPRDPAPVVYVMPRKRLRLPRRHCPNLDKIGVCN
ncbi:MAG: hypothetical protein ACP5MI_02290 [Candidatus Kryptoniota bacterium]